MFRRNGLPTRLLTAVLAIAMAWATTPTQGLAEALTTTPQTQTTTSASSDASSDASTSNSTPTGEKDQEATSSKSSATGGDSSSSNDGEKAGATDEKDSKSNGNSGAVALAAPAAPSQDTSDSKDGQSTFTAHWTNAPDKEVSYTNADSSNEDTWKNQVIDCSGGSEHKSTLRIHMNLAGDAKTTTYKAGSVKIYVPAGFYRGYDKKNPLRTTSDGSQIQWNVPKAPNITDATDFNYVEETREVDGQQVKYYVMQNDRDLAGATELDFDVSYRFVPYALDLTGSETQPDGSNRGVYKNAASVSCEVNGSEISSNLLNVLVKTHVETSTTELTHATKDANNGVFISWDSAWGEKPSDADKYFYVVWYAFYNRAGGSSQPYTYTMSIDDKQADGGKLVGVRKCVGQHDNKYHEAYDWSGYVFNRIDSTYAGIASNADYLGKQWIGIYDKTFNGIGYWITDGGGQQAYYFLMKYPRSMIKDTYEKWEKEEGKAYADKKMAEDGVPVTCGLKVKETWKDGHTESYTVSPNADGGNAAVKSLPKIDTGKRTLTKTWTNHGSGYTEDPGAQTLIAAGNDVTLRCDYTMYVYNVDDKATWDESSATYKASTGFDAKDGKYYLYSSTPGSNSSGSVYGKKPGIENISDRDPLQMSDNDYSYETFYMDDDEFDVSYLEHVGWQKGNAASQDFSSYAPIEVWCRTKGKTSFEKYGKIRRTSVSSYDFKSADGKTVVEGVNAGKRVSFPKDTVQVEIKQKDSNHFATSLSFHYSIRVHATDAVRARLRKDIEKNQNSLFGGFASGELTVEGKSLGNSGETAGSYWHAVSFALTPLRPSNRANMTYSMMGDNPNKSIKGVQVIESFSNWCDSPHEYQQAKYMHDYMVTSGVIYDLLPAGTYVKPEEVRTDVGNMGDWQGSVTLSEHKVELIDNWNGTGRTMMKVTVNIPDEEKYRIWHDDFNGVHAKSYGIRLVYHLYNSYINIEDRGGLVRGTAMFVNTSDDNVVFNSNAKDSSFTGKGFDDWDAFKGVAEEAWKKNYECSIVTATTDFGTVPYRQSGFENSVTIDNGQTYSDSAQVYPGDSYALRLHYTSKGNTRSDGIVLYDTVSPSEKAIGRLQSVDVSSIAGKVTYDASNPSTTDTCNPVVYYSTVVPSKDQMNLDNNNAIWKVWTSETDPSQVKAIAIDCRKTKSGASFVLDSYGTLVANIHMQATKNADTAESKDLCVGRIDSRIFSGSGAGESGSRDQMNANCTVQLLKANLSINKSSNPASGTEDKPTEIGNRSDTAIAYTITVKNEDENSSDRAVHDVALCDVLPNGFELDNSKEITVNGKSIDNQSVVSHTVEGATLRFVISSLVSNGSVAITIPAIRKKPVEKTTTYVNKATIDKVGQVDWTLTSNSTYHKTSVTTMPLAGAGGFAGLVAAGCVVLGASAVAWVRRRRRE